jgi:hypothetical protein
MDYLHGDVVDGEREACCAYEYARETPVLREAARRSRDIASQAGLPVIKVIETVAEEIEQRFSCGGLILQSPWLEFILCSNFPEKPWNSLSPEDRAGILHAFAAPRGLVLDVRRLDAMGVFDSLKEKAARARAESLKHLQPDTTEQSKRRLRVLPMVQTGPLTHILLTLDPDETEAQWVKGFRSLLRENKKRFGESRDTTAGRSGEAKDMLKALAAWRLLEHCGGDWKKANNFANEHRKVFEKPAAIVIGTRGNRKKIRFEKGDPKPFHDPRRGQGKQQINKVSLYNEEKGFVNAKERAQGYLMQFVPAEFFGEAEDAELEEMRARMGATEPVSKEALLELAKEARASLEALQLKLQGSSPTLGELAQMSEAQLDQLVAEQSRRVLARRKSPPPPGQP